MTQSARRALDKLRKGPKYGLCIGQDVSLQSAHVLVAKGLAKTTAIVDGLKRGYMLQPKTTPTWPVRS